MKKYLIAYFSYKGHTETIARMIEEMAGGDLFQIETAKPYPEDYQETVDLAKSEQKNEARPELKGQVSDPDSYDVIFLGFPLWWYTFPMAVSTFLEAYEFSGKTIIPFCTHGGSGISNSVNDIRKLCPNAEVENAISIYGSNAKDAKSDIEKWIADLSILLHS